MLGKVIKIDENGQEIARNSLNKLSEKKIRKAMKIRNIFAHPTWFAKKDIFIKNNGYRELEACEDYDFLLRTLEKDYKIGILPEYILKYRVRRNSICNTKEYIQYRNTQIIRKFYKKGMIEQSEAITNEINKDIDKNKEENHLKINNYIKEFYKMSTLNKLIQIPIIIVKLIFNSQFRKIVVDHIRLNILIGKV